VLEDPDIERYLQQRGMRAHEKGRRGTRTNELLRVCMRGKAEYLEVGFSGIWKRAYCASSKEKDKKLVSTGGQLLTGNRERLRGGYKKRARLDRGTCERYGEKTECGGGTKAVN